MPPAACAIECRDLSRTFGTRKVLDQLRFSVKAGSITALVGSNGAGKTTLMKILATLLVPTSGLATVAGLDVTMDPQRVRRCIGYVPSEERSFYWRLTVRQNLEFFAAMHGLAPAAARRDCDSHLEALSLLGRADTRFGELSTGMKQALGIIRGLLHDPAVLLLDEPTRSLSPDLAQRAWGLLRRQAVDKGRTILIATHNLGEAQGGAEEVAVLHQGRIQACGPLARLHGEAGLAGDPNLERLFFALTGDALAQAGQP